MSKDPSAWRRRGAETEPDRLYRCGTAARWLPRTLAAAILVTAMLGAFRLDPAGAALLPMVRQFVVFAGALLALGVARKGAEVRIRFGLASNALIVTVGSRNWRLLWPEIQRLDWAAPFAGSLSWLPATVLIDRDGRSWRVPALIDGGDQLLVELLRRAERHDLDSWAEVYHVVPRMARYRLRIRVGYAIALLILVVGVAYYLH